MDKEQLRNEKFLRIYFINNELVVVDVNNDTIWEKIMNQRQNIARIETREWIWNLVTNEITFH